MLTLLITFLVIMILITIYKNKKEEENNVDEEVSSTVEIEKTVAEEKHPIKRINFPVVGLNYEGRRKVLTDIIKQYKKEGMFMFEPYDGYTNKEMIEDYIDKLYEISYEGLPDTIIEKEDDNPYDENALKVMVKDTEGIYHQIGYVPKEYCVQIRRLMNEYKILVGSTITGGKYKAIDYDDYGNEKVKNFNSKYGLNLSVSFWDE